MIPSFAPYRNSGGAGDPYFADVSLLLHCDGANGSTSFVDSSAYAHTVTASGSMIISGTNPKFGSGCALSQGSWSDHLTIANAAEFDLAAGDFTVEGWVNYAGVGASGGALIGRWEIGPSTNADWLVYFDTSRHVNFFANGSGSPIVGPVTVPNDGLYHHIAVTRQGNTFRLFLDGVLSSTATSSVTIQNTPSQVLRTNVWGDTVNSRLDGRWDEIRITKGVCRYTTSFTPAGPFPNHA